MRPRRPRATSARPLDSLRVSGRSTRPPSRSHGSPHQCPRRAEGGETRDQEEREREEAEDEGGDEEGPSRRPNLPAGPCGARRAAPGLGTWASALRAALFVVLVGGGAASAGQHGGQLRRGWLGRQRRRRDVQRLLGLRDGGGLRGRLCRRLGGGLGDGLRPRALLGGRGRLARGHLAGELRLGGDEFPCGGAAAHVGRQPVIHAPHAGHAEHVAPAHAASAAVRAEHVGVVPASGSRVGVRSPGGCRRVHGLHISAHLLHRLRLGSGGGRLVARRPAGYRRVGGRLRRRGGLESRR
mmetsp:Transcript_90525/g.235760  ORF Transcript_90525/g.235760 Transcript_90525/m.235760 type:complete len:297 (+) Transcript_90525:62-952(+)